MTKQNRNTAWDGMAPAYSVLLAETLNLVVEVSGVTEYSARLGSSGNCHLGSYNRPWLFVVINSKIFTNDRSKNFFPLNIVKYY